MLKRFVTYIYQYDRGNRGQNTGFVKADIRDAGCRIQIQLRGQERFQGKCRVYLIVPGETAAGIPAGELSVRQGLGQLNLAYAKNQLGASGYSVSQIQAVVILCADGKLLASCWSEHVPESVLRGKFDIWGETADTKTAEEGTFPPGAAEGTARTDTSAAAEGTARTDTSAAPEGTARTDARAAAEGAARADIGTIPEAAAGTDLGRTAVSVTDADTRMAAESASGTTASTLTDGTAGKPADTALSAEAAPANPLSAEPDAPNADTGSGAIPAVSPASDSTAEDRMPEDAPALGIVDAPASPDETLIDFGVTAEEISAGEPQAMAAAPLSASQALPDANGISEAAASPFLKAQGDWAQIPHPFSNPSGGTAESTSCPCQNQAPAEQNMQPDAPGLKAETPEPKPGPPVATYKKIALTDIRTLLPKRNWYLCSNSFLIHGFFNYHYLILKTVEYNDQKKCYLGVPGIYEQPERTMAFMFGFPGFEPARAGEESLGTALEAAGVPAVSFETGVFGYWMLQLMDEM